MFFFPQMYSAFAQISKPAKKSVVVFFVIHEICSTIRAIFIMHTFPLCHVRRRHSFGVCVGGFHHIKCFLLVFFRVHHDTISSTTCILVHDLTLFFTFPLQVEAPFFENVPRWWYFHDHQNILYDIQADILCILLT